MTKTRIYKCATNCVEWIRTIMISLGVIALMFAFFGADI